MLTAIAKVDTLMSIISISFPLQITQHKLFHSTFTHLLALADPQTIDPASTAVRELAMNVRVFRTSLFTPTVGL